MATSDKTLLQAVNTDLQVASRTRCVLYLEDENDVDCLFCLLGVTSPVRLSPPQVGSLHQGVLVRSTTGSVGGAGSKAVQRRIEVTEGLRGYERVFGITDGDGESLTQLAAKHDAPYTGRHIKWKVYCIENLLAKGSWPPAWGAAPSWPVVLRDYAPYSALNRLHLQMLELLRGLGLHRFTGPALDEALKTPEDMVDALRSQQKHIIQLDVAQRFHDHLQYVEAAIQSSEDEGHALINGKWLVEDYAPRRTRLSPEQCRKDWLEHVRKSGGLLEVRELWRRLTGFEP